MKTDEFPPMTFFPLFEDSVQDRSNEKVGVTSAIGNENSGDTGSQRAIESSSVHTDEGLVAQSSTGSVTEGGIINVVNPEESVSNSIEGFSVTKNGDFQESGVSEVESAGKKDSSSDVVRTKSGRVVKSTHRPGVLYY